MAIRKLPPKYRPPHEQLKKKRWAKRASDKTRQARWGPLLSKTQFTELANGFLDHYAKIKVDEQTLNSSDAMFIVHLMRFKWDQHPPHPSYEHLAYLMGLTVPAVRKIARKLEKMNLVQRIPRYEETISGTQGRQCGNYYVLDGLLSALSELIVDDQPGLKIFNRESK